MVHMSRLAPEKVMRNSLLSTLAPALLALFPSTASRAGEADPTGLRTASAESLVESSPVRPAAARFAQLAAQPGDRVFQEIAVTMTIATQITQSGQIANETIDEILKQQRREIEVLEVADGRATRFRASFPHSRRQSPQDGDGKSPVVQPIEGKSYLAVRRGDELIVNDSAGAALPAEEYKLVREALDNVGKPNPLAELLVGRRIVVGEKILVPRKLARPLLGLNDDVGEVRKFELQLLSVQSATGAHAGDPLADFAAKIEIAPTDASPMAMSLAGQIQVETSTCRVRRSNFTGPIHMSSIERTAMGIYQYSAGGDLEIATRSQYGVRTGE